MPHHSAPITRLLPFLRWRATLSEKGIHGDLTAGLSVALVMIPQSLAYAQLAGFPAHYGLYAAMLPTLLGALFGSSPYLSTGAVALTGMLTAASIAPLATSGSADHIALGVTLALLAGLIQLALGILRQGWVLNLLSRPVFSGFINAAALLICFSQLPVLLGAQGPRAPDLGGELIRIGHALSSPDMATLAFGLLAWVGLRGLQRFAPKWPGVLVVVVISIGISSTTGYGTSGEVVGSIPPALPTLSFPQIPGREALVGLLPAAFVIALVSFLEAASSAKRLSDRSRHAWNENQELIGQGLAKLGAAVSGTLPTSASFSRSALSYRVGANTGLTQVISAIVLIAATLSLAYWLHDLPKAVLAAIILHAVANLIDFPGMVQVWRIDRDDALACWATFAATLAFAPQIQNGILTGLLLSLALVIWQSMKPRVALLGLHEDDTYRDLERFGLEHPHPALIILRFDGRLQFVNAARFSEAMEWARHIKPGIRCVLLSGAGINAIDTTGLHALTQLAEKMREDGQLLAMCGLKKQVIDVLERDPIWPTLAEHAHYRHEHAAVEALKPLLEKEKSVDGVRSQL